MSAGMSGCIDLCVHACDSRVCMHVGMYPKTLNRISSSASRALLTRFVPESFCLRDPRKLSRVEHHEPGADIFERRRRNRVVTVVRRGRPRCRFIERMTRLQLSLQRLLDNCQRAGHRTVRMFLLSSLRPQGTTHINLIRHAECLRHPLNCSSNVCLPEGQERGGQSYRTPTQRPKMEHEIGARRF